MFNKLTIYRTDSHDHAVAVLSDSEVVFSNDHGYDNVLKLAEFLDLEYEVITLNREEFERRFV